MPVGNFFLMVLGERSQGKPKEFTGGCAVQMVKLYVRHSKKRSKITFIRVCFFCALAHGHSKPVCNFSSSVWGGWGGGVRRNAEKNSQRAARSRW